MDSIRIATENQSAQSYDFSWPRAHSRKNISVCFKEDERYFLRVLLHHITDGKSFVDMITVNETVYATYQETYAKLGLL